MSREHRSERGKAEESKLRSNEDGKRGESEEMKDRKNRSLSATVCGKIKKVYGKYKYFLMFQHTRIIMIEWLY